MGAGKRSKSGILVFNKGKNVPKRRKKRHDREANFYFDVKVLVCGQKQTITNSWCVFWCVLRVTCRNFPR